jgi:hypothetical protein
MTREQAIDKLVELDVAQWGESEREASRQLHSKRSHALAVNAVAHYDVANIDRALAAEAKALMTAGDRAQLRKGG